MPKTIYPRDRFDLARRPDRVGAHRAENPHMRGWVVFLWALLATVVLVAVGIFASLVLSARVALFPTPPPTVAPAPSVTPVVDTSYSVLVLNATPEDGLATRTKDTIVAAGWSAADVLASDASSADFAETTVFYAFAADEAAAAGLAGLLGDAQIAQSDIYQPEDDPDTADDDEGAAKQLTVVLGLDRVASPSTEPTG